MKWFLLLVTPLIRNPQDKVCAQCKFFSKIVTYHDVVGDNDYVGICERFGEKNVVTGEIQYKSAIVRRSDNDLCKTNGLYFVLYEETKDDSDCDDDCVL
jgi:hypothetical protein